MSDFEEPARRIFSVFELNNETKKLLEQRFFSVFVRGEVSNFSAPRSGHWYFTIKDDAAQIRVVMFKQANFKYAPPKLGDEIIVGGQLSFYRERGEIQIIANQMKAAGLGDLQKQFDQLTDKLRNEGLFDTANKQNIPSRPKKIAIITSPTGAVIQDISRVCARRAPTIPLLLIPVPVQGESAAAEICSALKHCDTRKDLDLIILTRGGGSLEDLVAFNSEPVARAIVESSIPIISGVGHETDVSISDFVADLRAATPSEAAELATAGFQNLRSEIHSTQARISKLMQQYLSDKSHQLERLSIKLSDPSKELLQIAQKLDHLETQLQGHRKTMMGKHRAKLVSSAQRLLPSRLSERIALRSRELDVLQGRLLRGLHHHHQASKQRFTQAITILETLNPMAVMTRGYSIVFDKDRGVITSAVQVTRGQSIDIELMDGNITSEIKEIRKAPPKKKPPSKKKPTKTI